MLFLPSTWLFFMTLLLGVMLSISSDSWFGAWCGLELNLLSFIPFLVSSSNVYATEASLKYFLIQALGSSFIVLGALESLLLLNSLYLLSLALLLKMGAAPFYFWFPQVMEGISWIQCIVLMTVQKIAPMLLLSHLLVSIMDNFFIFWGAIFSAVVGAIGGINQTLLRKIIAYSSINHMSWMLFSLCISETTWLIYFLFYVLISVSVVMLFEFQQVYHFSQLLNYNNSSVNMTSFMSLLSMGGLPPFTGFIPKWIVAQEFVLQSLFFPLLILFLSSLVTLYYYLRIVIMFLVITSPKAKWGFKFHYKSLKTPFVLVINFVGLMFPSLLMLM